jgi:hypothetical protein
MSTYESSTAEDALCFTVAVTTEFFGGTTKEMRHG